MSCKYNNSMYTTVHPVVEEDTIFEDDFFLDNDPYYEIIEDYRKMVAWGEY